MRINEVTYGKLKTSLKVNGNLNDSTTILTSSKRILWSHYNACLAAANYDSNYDSNFLTPGNLSARNVTPAKILSPNH